MPEIDFDDVDYSVGHTGLVYGHYEVDVFVTYSEYQEEYSKWANGDIIITTDTIIEAVTRERTQDWFKQQGLTYGYHNYGASIAADFKDGDESSLYCFYPDQKDLAMLFKLTFGGK